VFGSNNLSGCSHAAPHFVTFKEAVHHYITPLQPIIEELGLFASADNPTSLSPTKR